MVFVHFLLLIQCEMGRSM